MYKFSPNFKITQNFVIVSDYVIVNMQLLHHSHTIPNNAASKNIDMETN